MERNEHSHCVNCGVKLTNMESYNNPPLRGQCVTCFTSPKQTAMRQAENDMVMSPFTSVRRITQHMTGPMHGLTEEDIQHFAGHLWDRAPGADPYDVTAQSHWRSIHGILHGAHESGAVQALPIEHPETSTQTSEDPFDVFNDRRSD